MFDLNEKIVYPGHGVAKINRIIEKKFANTKVSFFELKFLNKDMTILVPTINPSSVGIRKLSSSESIEEVFKVLSQPVPKSGNEVMASNWNKRNKEYQCKLRTGDIHEITAVYRELNDIAAQKDLSFGEKNLLEQTQKLLVEEIANVTKINEEKVIENLRSLFKNMKNAPTRVVEKQHYL
ncbi:MAG TPA: CarD family transcriptional regulator [Candidatus Limnocylindria bacterium]|nr:CarD family transcriptional regulator [Candidatus Limnocylindria bacterium]